MTSVYLGEPSPYADEKFSYFTYIQQGLWLFRECHMHVLAVQTFSLLSIYSMLIISYVCYIVGQNDLIDAGDLSCRFMLLSRHCQRGKNRGTGGNTL